MKSRVFFAVIVALAITLLTGLDGMVRLPFGAESYVIPANSDGIVITAPSSGLVSLSIEPSQSDRYGFARITFRWENAELSVDHCGSDFGSEDLVIWPSSHAKVETEFGDPLIRVFTGACVTVR